MKSALLTGLFHRFCWLKPTFPAESTFLLVKSMFLILFAGKIPLFAGPTVPTPNLRWKSSSVTVAGAGSPAAPLRSKVSSSCGQSWSHDFGNLHIYIYICLSVYLSIYLSIYPSIHLSIYPSIHPSIYLSIYYIYTSIFLSLSLYIYNHIIMYVYIYIHTEVSSSEGKLLVTIAITHSYMYIAIIYS